MPDCRVALDILSSSVIQQHSLNIDVSDSDETEYNELNKDRKSHIWTETNSFESFDDAKQYLTEEGFTSWYSKTLDIGKKFYFRCGRVLRESAVQCAKQAIIFAPSNQLSKYTVLQTEANHDHDNLPGLKKGKFSEEVVAYIVQRKKDGAMPKRIIRDMHELKEKKEKFVNDKIPTVAQLAHIVRRENATNGENLISLGDLIKWLEQNTTFPVDEDECFVVDFDRSKPGENLWFQFAVSTPRLLKFCVGLKRLCIDATYKLNWNGFPVIVIGTTDEEKRFHPLFFLCVKTETTKDYEFAFKALKKAVETYFDTPFNPEYVIADGAPAIKNAFFNVFPDSAKAHIMCFAHVMRNVRKFKFDDAKANTNKILEDIRHLQLSHSKKVS